MDNKRTNAPESPCIRHCCLNEKDICLGCFRTLEEIIQWSQANQSTRQTILQHAQQRRDKAILDKPQE